MPPGSQHQDSRHVIGLSGPARPTPYSKTLGVAGLTLTQGASTNYQVPTVSHLININYQMWSEGPTSE